MRNQIEISTIYSSEQLQVYKPNIDFFEKILEELNLSEDEIVYVGDSQIEDILASSKLDINNIWVNRKQEDLGKGIPTPLLEITDFNQLTVDKLNELFL